MNTIGWTLAALPVIAGLYAYAGYPLLLWIIARGRPLPLAEPRSAWPRVSVVVPAYNEEHQIGGALDALLAQNYPAGLLQIVVASDASTDATDRIVSDYAARGVELMRMSERSGKTKAENTAASLLNGEIIVNTDASIRLHPAAVRELVMSMSDPEIGVASGRDVSIAHADEAANMTEAGYVQYEMRIRALETRAGGIVGASGSCYAIRDHLHKVPIREDLSRDFSAALTAQSHGYRAVSVDTAICFVPRTPALGREYRRKVRTIGRGMDTLFNKRALLNPFRHGLFAWKLISHKLCRWLVPLTMVPGILGLLLLSVTYAWARVALSAGALVALLAALGAAWPAGRSIPRILSLAAFGVAANLAVLVSVVRLSAGGKDYIWEPTRRNPGVQ